MPHLTLVEKSSGKTHRIEVAEAIAGRDPACAILLEGDEAKTVSSRHARFFLDDSRWCVEDAGSRNGTYIGTRKLEPGSRHPLSAGDVVGLGLTGTQLSVHEAVARTLAATMLEAAPAVPPPPTATKSPDAAASVAGQVRLVVRDQAGNQLVGQGDRVTIGRALDCIIRIQGDNATSVSRVHAEVGASQGAIAVKDGGSRHGTFVNGNKIEGPTPIKVGDILVLGPGGPALTIEAVTSDAPASPGSAPVMSASPSAEAGPTGVRGAVRSPVDASAKPGRHSERSATRKTAPAAASIAPDRRRLWSVIAAVLVVAIALGSVRFFNARARDNAARDSAQVRQQAEEARSAAVVEYDKVKAALDSTVAADGPPTTIDSLRQALADLERRIGGR